MIGKALRRPIRRCRYPEIPGGGGVLGGGYVVEGGGGADTAGPGAMGPGGTVE